MWGQRISVCLCNKCHKSEVNGASTHTHMHAPTLNQEEDPREPILRLQLTTVLQPESKSLIGNDAG